VVVNGWVRDIDAEASAVMSRFEARCAGFLCTLVDREGMLEGTDLDWFAGLRQATTLPITAAGGVTTIDEVRALLQLGVDVAIGMAVYTGRLALDDLRAL
jgi:phosphoribosylformimino-5-aminoimidazole carboxamide ribonucleotide (ProFAR) isomerase